MWRSVCRLRPATQSVAASQPATVTLPTARKEWRRSPYRRPNPWQIRPVRPPFGHQLLKPSLTTPQPIISLTAEKPVFCYTEHNRVLAAGSNGVFMYKTPSLFSLRRKGCRVHFQFSYPIDLLRLLTRSTFHVNHPQHFRKLFEEHLYWVRQTCLSTSWLENRQVILTGRAFRVEPHEDKDGITNRYYVRIDNVNSFVFGFPFQFKTECYRDNNGNHILNVACLPIDSQRRDKFVEEFISKYPVSHYTGKGLFDPRFPVYMRRKLKR
eukprot:TRINITY_DN6588_c0_g1_i1.p1 TRINITY_DN6588_c0_g1~~TRINITY_DN6588_c0_g1_i1.p1  ORF type:complete len:281 (-),score=49.38 TRINITY_DN6588_c0_g1_i1:18-818(-)